MYSTDSILQVVGSVDGDLADRWPVQWSIWCIMYSEWTPVGRHNVGAQASDREIQSNVDGGQEQPAYFVSISIDNTKCFGKRQTLNLADADARPYQWTLLIGENGVGKTTLLQCLAGMQPVETMSGTMSVVAPLIVADAGKISGLMSCLDPRTGELSAGIECTATIGPILSDRRTPARKSTWSQRSNIPWYMVDAVLVGLVCYGYGASRRMGNTVLSEARQNFTSLTLFDPNADLINAEEWLLQADYAARRQERTDSPQHRRLEQIKALLVRLLPDVSSVDIVEKEGSNLPVVQAETPYGRVPIRNLSLGYQSMLTWMVDLASRLFDRYPDSPDPLAEPAIVLIDEIDLHLHPAWQRRLIEQLTNVFRNTQFIVTAHSPLVVQAAPEANIVLLRKEGDQVVIDTDYQRVRNWRVDQILTSDLFGLPTARPPQVDEAIQERTKILAKSKLTAKDRQRMKELDDAIGILPGGQTLADAHAMDIIRKAAELIDASKGSRA